MGDAAFRAFVGDHRDEDFAPFFRSALLDQAFD
jgi:hypothetical protein